MAALNYGIPLERWIDLSTGINPHGWIPPRPPDDVWRRLPEEHDDLERAARAYYGCDSLLAVAGSQRAIQLLPCFRPFSTVGVVFPGYSEHPHAWECHNHQVRRVAAGEIDRQLDELDVLVICNPNNPDGQKFSKSQLLGWHKKLAARKGWLVVDEAYMDASPEGSLATAVPRSGLIILRSLGKFFGLAGARVGFVLAEPQLIDRMRERLGPWTISGPSRWVATKALRDTSWQTTTRHELPLAAARLKSLLIQAGLKPVSGTLLFQYVVSEAVHQICDTLAKEGILVRHFSEPSAVRFGLPGKEDAWRRLENCLSLRLLNQAGSECR